MLKNLVFTLILFFSPFLILAKKPDMANMPPVKVKIQEIKKEDVRDFSRFVGNVEAVEEVELRARIEGYLQERLFKEGQYVSEGDVLFIIEKGPYEAAFKEAKGAHLRTKALLNEAELDLKRAKDLEAKGFASEQRLDNAIATYNSIKADMLSAEAHIQRAEIDLSYTEIKAPFGGVIGKANLSKGDLVSPNSDTLATIVQQNPIRVVFSVSEAALLKAKQNLDKWGGMDKLYESFIPEIELPDGSIYPERGKIEFVDNMVDIQTGTVSVRAIFPNDKNLLLPNQFVTLILKEGLTNEALTVSQLALQQDKEGFYVLVLQKDNSVKQQRIEVGKEYGAKRIINSGLKEGDKVITHGIQKIMPNVKVVVE